MGGSVVVVFLFRRLDGGSRISFGGRRRVGIGVFLG